MTSANNDNSSSKTWLVGLAALAFVVRAVIVLLMPDGLSRDTDSYRKIAESVRLTGTFGFPSQNLKFSNPDREPPANHRDSTHCLSSAVVPAGPGRAGF